MRSGRRLRSLIIARIGEAVPALSGRVSDRAVAGTAYPYCTLGASDWSRQDADCIDARTWSLQIDIWHSNAAKGVVEDLVDDVAAALADFEAPDLAMHPIEVSLARVMDDPSGDLHGVVQIEVDLDS